LKTGDNRPIVKLNIRIPNEKIKLYDIDFNMQTLVVGTTSGNVYIYDLPKALENERILQRKKIEMGVEAELVYTFLELVSAAVFLEHIQPF
jgi:hypothetical protein